MIMEEDNEEDEKINDFRGFKTPYYMMDSRTPLAMSSSEPSQAY